MNVRLFNAFILILYLAVLFAVPSLSNSEFNSPFPFSLNYIILIGFFSLVFAESYLTKRIYQWQLIGNYWKSIQLNTILLGLLLCLVGIILGTGIYNPQQPLLPGRGFPDLDFLIFYIFIGVPLQQLVIWGDFKTRINSLFSGNTFWKVLLTALVYSLIHGYYSSPEPILVATFIIGLYWGFVSTKTNSIIGNIFAHWIVGLIGFAIGFI